jgi:hypothetical protein
MSPYQHYDVKEMSVKKGHKKGIKNYIVLLRMFYGFKMDFEGILINLNRFCSQLSKKN